MARNAGFIGRSKTFIVVYLSFFLRAFSFIFLLPILTRIIEPAVWGGVLAAQSLGTWLALLLDFGFSISLTRKLAVDRENTEAIRQYVGDAYSAKLILFLVAAFLCVVISHFGALSYFPALAWWSLAWALAQGISPLWYYQAVENMYYFSLLEIAGRLAYILITLLFVKTSGQAYLIIAFQALTLLAVNGVALFRLSREVGSFKLSVPGAVRALKEGAVLSGFSIITSVYTAASTLIFSLFASPTSVSIYGNADRLVRAGISTIGPLNQVFLPRSSRAFAASVPQGLSEAKKLLALYLAFSVFVFAGVWIAAPLLTDILFHSNRNETLLYLRWLTLLFPLTSVNTVIVYHILIPLGEEKFVTKLYTFVSIVAIAAIILLVSLYGATGMVGAVIIPEVLALLVLTWKASSIGSSRGVEGYR